MWAPARCADALMVLDPSRVAPVPWRNGAGSTRELASVADSSGTLLWRISLADLDHDAPFSQFDGMDRTLVALGEIRLEVDGETLHLMSGEQARFRGEASTSVTLDRPARALNVMVRRDACSAAVVQRRVTDPAIPGAGATVILGHLAADVLIVPLAKGRP